MLQATGLLNQRLPIGPDDVARFLTLDKSYVAICFKDHEPCGYVVFCLRTMEQQIPELFILQAVGDGGPAWVSEGWAQMHALAAKMGCHRIGTVLPNDQAVTLARRFHFYPQGVYCTAIVRNGTQH